MFGWGSSKSSRATVPQQLPSTLRGDLVAAVNEGTSSSLLKRSVTSELENVGEVLGEGNYGVVKLRRDKNTGVPRAVKTVVKPDHWDHARLIREAEVMQNLDHPHILRLFAWHEMEDSIVMVTEFCAGGEIIKAVEKAKRENVALHQGWMAMVFQQLLEGISYIHDRGLVHRDIKSGNLLLMRAPETPATLFKTTPHAVVVDLGLAEIFGMGAKSVFGIGNKSKFLGDVRGTAGTMAPEVWKGVSGPKSDIWSLGCVFYEMMTGKLPYLPADPQDARAETWTKLISTTNVEWSSMLTNSGEDAKDFCRSMLAIGEKERPTSKELLKHSWINKFISSCPKDEESQVCDMPKLCLALCQWQSLKPMHRAVCLKLASESSGTSKFAVIFSLIDTDNNGVLTQPELTEALQNFGVSFGLAAQVADTLDYNGDGSCEYLEFAAACLSSLGEEYDEMLWQEFCVLDLGSTGTLNHSSFSRLLDKLKPLCVSHKMNFPDLDADGDGQIDWFEFASVFGRPGVDYSRIQRRKTIALESHPVCHTSQQQAAAANAHSSGTAQAAPAKAKAEAPPKRPPAKLDKKASNSALTDAVTAAVSLTAPAKATSAKSSSKASLSRSNTGGGSAGAPAAQNGASRKAKVTIISAKTEHYEAMRPHRQRSSQALSSEETGVPLAVCCSEPRPPVVPASTLTPVFLKSRK
eukprot:TRINITY_DN8720_c1_g3_i1.p1 TRINITY_DN8720_c1_g3~~TRINITY_DN8720_c1_g3_i1.p1  ORF type:complete len:692 (-),score=153.58 TRINITY_DN8720_c1_g3_i1:33-2108(-)